VCKFLFFNKFIELGKSAAASATAGGRLCKSLHAKREEPKHTNAIIQGAYRLVPKRDCDQLLYNEMWHNIVVRRGDHGRLRGNGTGGGLRLLAF